MMPLAFLLAGPLADQVFEPLLSAEGALAAGPLATLVGVGPGRGIGLLLMVSGLILIAASAVAFVNPRIRNLETDLPDAIRVEALDEEGTEAATAVSLPA